MKKYVVTTTGKISSGEGIYKAKLREDTHPLAGDGWGWGRSSYFVVRVSGFEALQIWRYHPPCYPYGGSSNLGCGNRTLYGVYWTSIFTISQFDLLLAK